MEFFHEPRKLTIEESIEAYLNFEPSDVNDSTVEYCQTGIDLGLKKIENLLQSLYPHRKEEIKSNIDSLSSIFLGFKPRQSIIEEDAVIFPDTDENKKKIFPLSNFLKIIAKSYPSLFNPTFVESFVYKSRPKEGGVFLTNITSRFQDIRQESNLADDDAILKMIAVAQYAQAPKIQALIATHKFVRHSLDVTSHENEKKLVPLFKSLERDIFNIQYLLSYIKETYTIINTLADSMGIERNAVSFVLDLAFLKKDAFKNMEEYQLVSSKYSRSLGSRDWLQTYDINTFLLTYFGNAFPKWRKEEFQQLNRMPTFNNYIEVEQAIEDGFIDPETIHIPDALIKIIGTHFPIIPKEKTIPHVEPQSPSLSQRKLEPIPVKKQDVIQPLPTEVVILQEVYHEETFRMRAQKAWEEIKKIAKRIFFE